MKTLFFLLTLLAVTPIKAQQAPLTVVIHEIKSTTGLISVAVYNNEKDFMKKKFERKSVHAQAGDVQVVFDSLPAGTYAISVMHDENENGELDSNFMGIPKEGFGFSNDAKATFGPPSFDKALFTHNGAETISINMKYF